MTGLTMANHEGDHLRVYYYNTYEPNNKYGLLDYIYTGTDNLTKVSYNIAEDSIYGVVTYDGKSKFAGL
jgi:hypothetical protein